MGVAKSLTQSEVSISGGSAPIAGYAFPNGFRLWVKRSEKQIDVLTFSPSGLRLKKERPLPFKFPAVYIGFMTLLALMDKWAPSPESVVYVLIIHYIVTMGTQLSGIASWHALEHKTFKVVGDILNSKISVDFKQIKKALNEAPSTHPRCGSVFYFWATTFLMITFPLLPAALAQLISFWAAWVFYRKSILFREYALPLQHLVLAPPSEAQIELVAHQLCQYFKENCLLGGEKE